MGITVNGHDAESGCYVDGHWGQYGPDRVAEIAEGFGFSFANTGTDDPRLCRLWADEAEGHGDSDGAFQHWERHIWAADAIEEWLNSVTVGGYWSWEDGEFFLVSDDDDEQDY